MRASLLIAAMHAAAAASSFKLASLFGNNMVLQSGNDTMVWGFAAPGTVVFPSLDSQQLLPATSDATGIWKTPLPYVAGGFATHTLSFKSSDGGSSSLTGVLFGEVFLCSGQSNMDMPVSYAGNSTAEIAAAAAYTNIRLFGVVANQSTVPLDEFITPPMEWVAPKYVVAGFSAICFFAGRDIFNGLGGNTPVGLIHSALGGTPIQAWSSAAAATKCPNVTNNYRESVLFNAMINPLTVGPLAMAGILWVQGEQNTPEISTYPTYYSCALPTLISDWRERFAAAGATDGGSSLAFLGYMLHPWNATLPTYQPTALPLLRHAQLSALSLPNVSLSPAIDGGDPFAPATSIHPRGKQVPASRMATAALAMRYGQNLPYSAPLYDSAAAVASAAGTVAVEVSFVTGTVYNGLHYVAPNPASNSSRCPTDLTIPADLCDWFGIMLNDAPFPNGTWINATATIGATGATLVLTAPAPAGTAPAGTRNGWAGWPVVNFYSGADLPVLPWLEPL